MDMSGFFSSAREFLGLDTTYALFLFLLLSVMAAMALCLRFVKGVWADKLGYYMGLSLFFVFMIMSIAPLVLLQI